MKPNELWNHLRNVNYHTSEYRKLDWCIEVDHIEHKIRVMFEESHQPIDWFFNFLFILIPAIIGGCPYWFSCGWWFSWNSAKEVVIHNVMTEWENYPDYDIEVCGYSFGGAIAQICGVEIFERMGIKPDLVTFGAPKPFFGLWSYFMAKRCFKSITKYAHWNDIVTYCIPLPCYHGLKNIRLGKFSLKGLFDPCTYHQIYGDEDIYKEVKKMG